MYTTIPHDDLIVKILLCLRETWSWYADKEGVDEDRVRLWITGSEAKWVLRSTRTAVKYTHNDWVLTRSALQELVRFIVKNTYVLNGGLYVDSRLAFRWAQIVLHYLQICTYTAMSLYSLIKCKNYRGMKLLVTSI